MVLKFENGEIFQPDEYIYTGQTERMDNRQQSKLTGFITALDEAGEIVTPNGKVHKKSMIGKWMLGVCGGYEDNELEHCGHVFSEMEEYNERAAVEQAITLVEKVRQYYMDRAKEICALAGSEGDLGH